MSSLWFDETPPRKANTLAADLTCDIAIIGGGICGISAAYALAKRGRRVAVFERGRLGEGSTGYSGGFLAASTTHDAHVFVDRYGIEIAKLIFAAIHDAVDNMRQIAEQERIACDFTQTGSLYCAAEPSHEAIVRKEAGILQSFGYAQELFEAADPRIPVKGVFASLYTPTDCAFNPLAFLHGVADVITRLGGSIYTDTPIVKVNDVPNGVELVTADGLRIRAQKSICAVSSWPRTQYADAAAKRACVPVLSRIVVTDPVPHIAAQWRGELIWDTYDVYHYLRLLKDGRVMVGGEDRWFGSPALHGKTVKQSYYTDRIIKKLEQYFPDMHFSVQRSWSGYLAYPLDGLPLIASRKQRISVITDGLPFGWLIGAIAAGEALGEHSPLQTYFDAQRDFGVSKNAFLRLPMPKSAQRFALKAAIALERLRDETDKLFQY